MPFAMFENRFMEEHKIAARHASERMPGSEFVLRDEPMPELIAKRYCSANLARLVRTLGRHLLVEIIRARTCLEAQTAEDRFSISFCRVQLFSSRTSWS